MRKRSLVVELSVFLCGEGKISLSKGKTLKVNSQSLVEQDLLDCGIVLLLTLKFNDRKGNVSSSKRTDIQQPRDES